MQTHDFIHGIIGVTDADEVSGYLALPSLEFINVNPRLRAQFIAAPKVKGSSTTFSVFDVLLYSI